jgi:uncharacterized membrane protein YkvA (DUF1232 family)
MAKQIEVEDHNHIKETSADNYSDEKLWGKIARYSKTAGISVIEKVLWLYYAAQRPVTPAWAKAVIYSAIAYFILPIDAIPDFIPITGFSDDLVTLSAAVTTIAVYIDDSVKAQTKETLKKWFGTTTN